MPDAVVFLDFVNNVYYSAGVGYVDVTELVGQNTGYPAGGGPLVIDGNGILILSGNSCRPVLIGDAQAQLVAACDLGGNGYVIMMEVMDDGDGISGRPYAIYTPVPSAAYTNDEIEINNTDRWIGDKPANGWVPSGHWDFNGEGPTYNQGFAGVGNDIDFPRPIDSQLVITKFGVADNTAAMAYGGQSDWQNPNPPMTNFPPDVIYFGFDTSPDYAWLAQGHIKRFAIWQNPQLISIADMEHASTLPFPTTPPYTFPKAWGPGPFLEAQPGDIVQTNCGKFLIEAVISSTKVTGSLLN